MADPVSIEVPGFLWASLGLARGVLEYLVDPDPEYGILTALHQAGVSDTYEAVRDVGQVVAEAMDGCTGTAPWDSPRASAMVEFLKASIAVWREYDRLEADPDLPIRRSVELRDRQRAAWERYRDAMSSHVD